MNCKVEFELIWCSTILCFQFERLIFVFNFRDFLPFCGPPHKEEQILQIDTIQIPVRPQTRLQPETLLSEFQNDFKLFSKFQKYYLNWKIFKIVRAVLIFV